MSVVRREPRGGEGQPGGLAAGNKKYVTALLPLTQVVTPAQEPVVTRSRKRRSPAHSALANAPLPNMASRQGVNRGLFMLSLYAPSPDFSHPRELRGQCLWPLSAPRLHLPPPPWDVDDHWCVENRRWAATIA